MERKDAEAITRFIMQNQRQTIFFGVVTAIDTNKKLLKVELEPYGTETGWCKVVKGLFPCEARETCKNKDLAVCAHAPAGCKITDHRADMEKQCQWSKDIPIGLEVLVAAIWGAKEVQYVVVGELE